MINNISCTEVCDHVNNGLDYSVECITTGLTLDLNFSHIKNRGFCKRVRLIVTSHKDVICGEHGGFKYL